MAHASGRKSRPVSVSATLWRSRSSSRASSSSSSALIYAQRRLHDAQALRGPAEMQFLGERHERAQMLQFHAVSGRAQAARRLSSRIMITRFITAATLLIAVVCTLIVAASFWMVSNRIEDEKARRAERENEAV